MKILKISTFSILKKVNIFGEKSIFFEIIFSENVFHRKKNTRFCPKIFSFCFLIIYHVHPLQVASCNSLCAAHKRGKRPPKSRKIQKIQDFPRFRWVSILAVLIWSTTVELHGDRSKLHGDRLKLHGDRSKLDGDRLKLHGDRSKLDGDHEKLHVDRSKLLEF